VTAFAGQAKQATSGAKRLVPSSRTILKLIRGSRAVLRHVHDGVRANKDIRKGLDALEAHLLDSTETEGAQLVQKALEDTCGEKAHAVRQIRGMFSDVCGFLFSSDP